MKCCCSRSFTRPATSSYVSQRWKSVEEPCCSRSFESAIELKLRKPVIPPATLPMMRASSIHSFEASCRVQSEGCSTQLPDFQLLLLMLLLLLLLRAGISRSNLHFAKAALGPSHASLCTPRCESPTAHSEINLTGKLERQVD
jgi:hypothetical protein